MKHELLIGIDGGGTHSSAVAVWPDGQVAAVAHGGGMNYHNDGVETVRCRLETVVKELTAQCGAADPTVCAGLSALDGPADESVRAQLASASLPAEQLDLQSDAYAALMGCTLGEPGMIVICGTGSMLLLADSSGRQHVSGGWGYLLNDAGSGFTLAREALLAVTAAADGTGPATPLTARALAYFSAETPRQLINRVYAPSCGPDRIAGFAACVLQEAAEGCPEAQSIVGSSMGRLASQAVRLLQKAPGITSVGLYGGVFVHSPFARQAFENALRCHLPEVKCCDPAFPPELGAVIHLLRRRGRLSEQILSRMKTSWKEKTHERD